MTTADELRREAESVLRPLSDLAAPVRPGSEPPWDQLVRVGEHQVQRSADCPASLAHDGDFDGWRAAFARRRLGLKVLDRLRAPGAPAPQVVAAQAVEDLAADGRDGFGRWLDELGPGGRAVVVREAVGYAVAARGTLEAHGSWPPTRGTRYVAVPLRWDVPGRAVRLEAQADSLVVRGAQRYLLLLASTDVDDSAARRSVAWIALVSALHHGVVPRGVTRLDIDAGTRRHVVVADDVLDDGLTAAAAAVEAAVAARFGAPAPPEPGAWCRTCRGRSVCPVAT